MNRSSIPSHLIPDFDPVADPAATVTVKGARFTVLSSRTIRLESDPEENFEDRPSQVIWYRRQSVPHFRSTINRDILTITTSHLELTYRIDGRGFSRSNPSIRLLESGTVWHYGDRDTQNLLGTARTLDLVDGALPLEPGLLSRSGWSLLDDSQSLVINSEGWVEPRRKGSGQEDLYFFGHESDYAGCLQDYCCLAGNVPMVPRWILGNWWSRYWAYSQEELVALMHEFQSRELPLSVCIVDMDWHITEAGEGVDCWTGYTWNRDLFPDPQGFINKIHTLGLRTALNLHPALGIRPHEEMYAEMAKRLGVDPTTKETILFDITDPAFMNAYFEVLHHPLEEIGVDFWWLDWQQGEICSIEGLDPLFWLNHLHFLDMTRSGEKRPFIFSRWSGPGNHRYPIGFSGDAIVSWKSLAFQPFFTATAANVAFGWWSHDIGGHMLGVEDSELFVRWVQFGILSPVMRFHSTNSQFHDRRPWVHGPGALAIIRDALQLRHALIPYLYSMAWLNYRDAISLVRPMYHDYPEFEEAYACPQQYMFGTEMIAAPFTSPVDEETGLSRQVVWLPQGFWHNFFTGEILPGGRWEALYGTLSDNLLFARAGAIIPMGKKSGWGGIENPDHLELHIFAGADGEIELFEDEGTNEHYVNGRHAVTRITQEWHGKHVAVIIDRVQGDSSLVPQRRSYRIHLHGIRNPVSIEMKLGGQNKRITSKYDSTLQVLVLGQIDLHQQETLHLAIEGAGIDLLGQQSDQRERLIEMLKSFKMETMLKNAVVYWVEHEGLGEGLLDEFASILTQSQKRAVAELVTGAGFHMIDFVGQDKKIVFWNNRQNDGVRYSFRRETSIWDIARRYDVQKGVVPLFHALDIPDSPWWMLFQYGQGADLILSGGRA